jgi:predicted nucleic acid-binding protein
LLTDLAVSAPVTAGDAFRAGFAVGLLEGLPLQRCMQLAAAAGAAAVSRLGAVPSLPTRTEVEQLIASLGDSRQQQEPAAVAAEGSSTKSDTVGAAAEQQQQSLELASSSVVGHCTGSSSSSSSSGGSSRSAVPAACPYKFASRLNSMKVRRDLAGAGHGRDDVLGWIARQGRVRGLSLVDLNYPQHAEGLATEQVGARVTRLLHGVASIV